MKKIIITGASGFIGKSLVNEFGKENFELITYSSIQGDIKSNLFWENIPKADILIHLAGKTYVPQSWEDPSEFLQTNSLAIINAINYCKKYKTRLIFLSSYIYKNSKDPLDEKSPITANNPYALSKLIAEEICLFYKKTQNLDVIILRPFNVFGPYQDDIFLIPKLIKQITRGKNISVFDINPKRDYIYIYDLIDLIKKVIYYDGKEIIFNVGTGKSHSVLEVINLLQKVLNTNLPIETLSKERPMEINKTTANIDLAKNELNWYPKYSMEEALRDLIKREKE